MTPDLIQELDEQARDARRYRWLRKYASHILLGWMAREGDSLLDLGPSKLDARIDETLAMRRASEGKD